MAIGINNEKPEKETQTEVILDKTGSEKEIKKLRGKLKQNTEKQIEESEEIVILDPKKMITTRSTLLDLAISGGKTEAGGLPGGILVEIHGPASSGKTGVIAEIASEVKIKGGEILFCDPEGRLNIEYTEITGLKIERGEYCRPNTVSELFNIIYNWKPKNPDAINMIAADSLAALSTELELEKGDKMGMKRAKEFSEGIRKTCRLIANNNWLIVCSNQERESDFGVITPGGKGMPYYSTVRIRMTPDKPAKIEKEKKIGKKTLTKVIGIRTTCEVKKNSFDDPFRVSPISFIFNYGVDDIRDQLQWHKEVSGDEKYNVFDSEYATMEAAIKYIEDNNLEQRLKARTIKKWKEIEDAFRTERKKRF